MNARVIIPLLMITIIIPAIALRAENELILEAATGVSSENKPLTSDWNGSLGSDGLLMREFAFRMTYNYTHNIDFSSTLGYLSDWEKPRYVFYSDRPDIWANLETKRKILYFRPDMRLSSDQITLDVGLLFSGNIVESLETKTEFSVFDHLNWILPTIGIQLGDSKVYMYANFAGSFPLISGGGLLEIGMGGRYHGLYEHKIYFAVTGYQQVALGYRGEFRIYKKTAITPGFSIGGNDRDDVYMMTIGIKSMVDL